MPSATNRVTTNHEEIRRWRRRKALEKTLRNRPELLKPELLAEEDRRMVADLQREQRRD